LAWEELVAAQFGVRVRRAAREAIQVERPEKVRDLIGPWYEKLPFQMTQGQKDVCKEIDKDLSLGRPMHRLLLGDVGSG
jgi:ATP-dependent DNA helicase RecG